MLRVLVALLLLANLLFFSWTQGWLAELLPAPHAQREPERLQRQVQPERVRLGQAQVRVIEPSGAVSGAPAAPSASSPAPAAPAPTPEAPVAAAQPSAAPPVAPPVVASARPVCLEAGAFSEAEMARLEPELRRGLPAGSWRVQQSERPSGYVVYTGRFPDRESLLRRQDELRELNVEFIEMREPSQLAMGLSLGRFRHRENAERHLSDLERRGVRNARVVPVGPVVAAYHVQLPAVDEALQQRLAEFSPRVLQGREFGPCSAPLPAR